MDIQPPFNAARLLPNESVFTLALDLSEGASVATHQHAEGQLLFATAGVLAITTDEGCWVVPGSHALWIPPHVPHWTRSIGAASIRTIYFSKERTEHFHHECVLLEINNLLRELVIAVLEIADDIIEGTRNDYLLKLFIEELKTSPVSNIYLPTPNTQRLKTLCQTIFYNGKLNWGLADCANYLGVNQKTVQRWFLNDLNMSFGAWRKQARLMVALQWLAAGKNILEISLEAGYSSPSAFSAMFRNEFGTPPSTFMSFTKSIDGSKIV